MTVVLGLELRGMPEDPRSLLLERESRIMAQTNLAGYQVKLRFVDP